MKALLVVALCLLCGCIYVMPDSKECDVINSCVSMPDKDVWILVVSPYSGVPFPFQIKAGDFDRDNVNDRGYMTFDTYAEAELYMYKMMEEYNNQQK